MPRLSSCACRCSIVWMLALLGGCASAPAGISPARVPAIVATPLPASAPRPVDPVPAPAPPPAPPVVVVTPATQQQALKQIQAAVESLELGKPEAARGELAQALQNDPGNRQAQHLMRQLDADPVELLGRESFAYTVRAGDTLSRISQRFLNDVHGFYILARYNDIQVPRQVASGQVLRIPGKAPPGGVASPAPSAPPAPPMPTAPPTSVGAPPPATPPSPPAATLPTVVGGAPAEQARREQQLVASHERQARSAFARQDLDGAIAQWDRVLALEPGHAAAQRERQRALALKAKLQAAR